MTTHIESAILAVNALSVVFGIAAVSDGASRHLQGVGGLETGYGDAWRAAGRGSNNIGAIQAGTSWHGDTFAYTDTHPNADGTSTPYSAKFRAYPTPLDGWIDLARVMYGGRRGDVYLLAKRGDTYSVSEGLRLTQYYEGFGPTVHDRVRNHMLALRKWILLAERERGLEVPKLALEGSPVGLPGTVKFGSTGDDVRTLQRELRLAADGICGRVTVANLEAYQKAHGLKPDGVCGPNTWRALLTDEYLPEAA